MEQPRQGRSYHLDPRAFDDLDAYQDTSYRLARSEYNSVDPMPLFLSDPDSEPDPREFVYPFEGKRRTSLSARILAAVVAAAAVAVLFAVFSSDAMRAFIENAKASVQPEQSAPPQPDPGRLTARDIQAKDPARYSGPGVQTGPAVNNVPSAGPTREEIANAYQAAMQGRAPAMTPTAPIQAAPAQTAATQPAAPQLAPAPTRRLDTGEIAALVKRAKSLIAVGDIAAARLFLERAAEAQDAGAAFLLAQTYDPAVLGTLDMRSVTPDPATARSWYEKAVQFGSVDAQQRLAQMQN
jgi:hypothetical protein